MKDMIIISSQEIILITIILVEETEDFTDFQDPMLSALIEKNRAALFPERYHINEGYEEENYLSQNEADSEDFCTEISPYTFPITDLSPRPRSYILSTEKNKRTSYYDTNKNMFKTKEITVTILILTPEGKDMGLFLIKSAKTEIKMLGDDIEIFTINIMTANILHHIEKVILSTRNVKICLGK
ncbi:hypothetical protein NPIL_188951 [Nephila pilipes]|uniref:Uncharacterized protein n=1 Tax=Nephila pilipes TaxID=299642 RepID=A0A8X6IZE7_NEPPI|nr:hypothetical protein NPIL_188951 [Nephila pilipes]